MFKNKDASDQIESIRSSGKYLYANKQNLPQVQNYFSVIQYCHFSIYSRYTSIMNLDLSD